MPLARLAPAMVAAVVLAGCLTAGVPEAATDAGAAAAPGLWDLPTFSLDGKDCFMAGFVAAYGMDNGAPTKLAEVWVLADIREEIGNPIHDATGFPVTGPLMGNWHMGGRCASVTSTAGDAEDFIFGFVGDVVEAPQWDTGGADLHFLVSGLSFANGTLGDAARASTTADITHTARVELTWFTPKELPRAATYVAFLDAEKGLYEAASTVGKYRDVEERTVRIWWQVPTDGSKHGAHHHPTGGSLTSFGSQEPSEGSWHPIYWDLTLGGGAQYLTPPVDGIEFGSHNKLSFEHGPVAGQPVLTNIYENGELQWRPGRVVEDVTLDLLWTH